MITNLKKENWKNNTEEALTLGFNRFFAGLDKRKIIFSKWEIQLLPLASQFVDQYTNATQLK